MGLCRYRGEGAFFFFLGITGTWEGWVLTSTDLFYNGVFAPGAGCRSSCILTNSWIYHNSSASLMQITLGARDVRSYSHLHIYGAITPYNSVKKQSTIDLYNYSGVFSSIVISTEQNKWKQYDIDISQLIYFNNDCYMKLSDISKGEYSDISVHTKISHIWLS